MAQEALEGQVQQNSSQSQSGQDASSESFVTPELAAKFREVYGDNAEGTESADKKPVVKRPQKLSAEARHRATQTQQRKAQQRKEFFGGTEEDEGAETKKPAEDSEESASNRSQPLKRGNATPAKPAGEAKTSSSQQQSSASGEEGDEDDGKGQQSQQGAADDDDDKPTLSPVLRHAARRAGFSDEDAQTFFEMSPEKAEGFFQKMHDSFNGVSAQYAQLGQQAAQQGQPQQQARQQPSQQQQQPAPQQGGDPVDDLITAMYGNSADKLAKDYNPEFVDEFARKPAKWLHDNVVAPMRQMQAFYQGQQARMVAQETVSYTKGLEADFGDLYGTEKSRSEEQQATLNEVYSEADLILLGAQRKRVNMSVSEALERAHNRVASKFLEQQTRKRVLAQVQKRSSQITQRPTQRKPGLNGNGQSDGKKTTQGAIEALTRRMQELGIEGN